MPPKKKPVPALLTAEHVPFNEQGLPESKDFTNLTKNQAAFLKAYIRFGSITNAARAVNMCREIFYHWM